MRQYVADGWFGPRSPTSVRPNEDQARLHSSIRVVLTVRDRGEVGKHDGHEGKRACRARPSSSSVAGVELAVPTRHAHRPAEIGRVPGGGVFRVTVPEAFGGKTVIGQLTVDPVVGAGFVTAYGCDDGVPTDASGDVNRSDLNYDSVTFPVRLQPADRRSRRRRRHLLLHAPAGRPSSSTSTLSPSTPASTSFPNHRTDTRHRPHAGDRGWWGAAGKRSGSGRRQDGHRSAHGRPRRAAPASSPPTAATTGSQRDAAGTSRAPTSTSTVVGRRSPPTG